MDEQEQTEATFLVGMRTREEVLGLPEDISFLQSLRPWQVKTRAKAKMLNEQTDYQPSTRLPPLVSFSPTAGTPKGRSLLVRTCRSGSFPSRVSCWESLR